MKQFQDTLREIYEKGIDHEDRTGTGRRSLFGLQLKFNLQEGFPLVTTRRVPYKAAFKEMLWFISGNTNISKLHEQNVHIWDLWAVKEKNIDDVMKDVEEHLASQQDVRTPDMTKEVIREKLLAMFVNQIGPMYGYIWRHAPVVKQEHLLSEVSSVSSVDEIASDKLAFYKSQYDQAIEQLKSISTTEYSEKDVPTFESFALNSTTQEVDQLQNVLVELKRNPYSSRHVLTTWIPQYIPISGMSPEENVLAGKGALAPCHVMVQFFVVPPETEGAPLRLSMKLFQRSADFPIGSVFNIAQYALFQSLVAHCVQMQPYEFIYSLGDVHIYLNQLEQVQEQLAREPMPLPKLVIKAEHRDLFKMTMDDFEIVGYESHPPIAYPISK